MPDATDRFALPLLAPGQAQKEITHNEALALIDALACPVIEEILSAPPASPSAGAGWIVGASPTGAWADRAGQLAFWTASGWRFVLPPEGMTVFVRLAGVAARRLAASWQQGVVTAEELRIGELKVVGARLDAVTAPTGGTTIDSEARAAIDSILDRLRVHGLIAA